MIFILGLLSINAIAAECVDYSGSYINGDVSHPISSFTIRQDGCESIEVDGKKVKTDGIERTTSEDRSTRWTLQSTLFQRTVRAYNTWQGQNTLAAVQSSTFTLLSDGNVRENIVRDYLVQCGGNCHQEWTYVHKRVDSSQN